MKKLIVAVFSMAGLVFSAQAQEPRKQTEKPGHRHHQEYLAKELNLTEAQKEQLKANRESAREQMAELEKNDQLTVKEYKLRKAGIQKAQKDKMDNILTEEQKKTLADKKMSRHGKGGKHKAHNMDELKSSLDLSDEQVARIKENQEKRKAEIRSVRENKDLTAEQKKERMKEIKTQSKSFYKETLTPEQFEKMESMKKQRVRKQK